MPIAKEKQPEPEQFQIEAFTKLQNLLNILVGKKGVGEVYMFDCKPYEKDTTLTADAVIMYKLNQEASKGDLIVLTDTEGVHKDIRLKATDLSKELEYTYLSASNNLEVRPLLDVNELVVDLILENSVDPKIRIDSDVKPSLDLYISGKKRTTENYNKIAKAIQKASKHFNLEKVGYRVLDKIEYLQVTDFALEGSSLVVYEDDDGFRCLDSKVLRLSGTLKLNVIHDSGEHYSLIYTNEEGAVKRFTNKLKLLTQELDVALVGIEAEGIEFIFEMKK